MVKKITQWEDSRGTRWSTLEEAEAAEAGYRLQAKFKEERDTLVCELTYLSDPGLIPICEYILTHYTLTPKEQQK